ncbi:glutamate--cysteine ligase [Limosilactobacillus vaginalis]|uniref:glutamate--cysteine ligase n=1 Tax=Limosilactobacillus vaginalis TaxID=1633 RepID=UPI0025A450A9|nr:glutamate--cysteine ligase [Limosilactobacillus vaginalis]MDM8304290.1 glutamate--cysteine ligase [Limosilactobacillus vaginalis]
MADRYAVIRQALSEPELNAKLFTSEFGLEAKKHRVLTNGRASRYPYPEALRSRRHNLYLNSGFTDNMIDFETSPVVGSKNAVRQLKMLEQIMVGQLHEDERLWPLSLAPAPVYNHDLDYLMTANTKSWDQANHDYLGKKYGITQELLGDVHVNFSLNKELLKALYEQFYKDEYHSLVDFQNHLYFKMAQCFVLYQWLFTYLYGASPVSEDVNVPEHLELPVRSLRCSDYGDDNLPNEQVSYNSLEEHFSKLQQFLDDGTYYSIKEFFGPVRCRRHNQDVGDLQGMLTKGINYLEFRSFDLDPLSRTGVSDDTINFLELLMINTLVKPLPDNLPEKLATARKLNNEVALQKPKEQTPEMHEAAIKIIAELQDLVDEFNAPREYRLALKFVQRRVDDPALTISGQLADQIENGNLLSFGLKLANDRFTANMNMSHPLQAISNEYSDDTQRLIKAAIELGVNVSFDDDGVTLTVGDHDETYEAQGEFDFPDGPRKYILDTFPEAIKFQEQQ